MWIQGNTLPEAWVTAVACVNAHGIWRPTEYGGRAKEMALMIDVAHPFAEPRVSRCLPCGLDDLEKYVCEVCYGAHDHWEEWPYTYHKRLCDQIPGMLAKLREVGYTRRANMVTWIPRWDSGAEHPPCLQSIWCTIQDEALNMHVRFRSNDLFKAAFMNMYALTEWQRIWADELGVAVGRYLHYADSMHIYEKDVGLIRPNRTWSTNECTREFERGITALLEEANMPQHVQRQLLGRLQYLRKRFG